MEVTILSSVTRLVTIFFFKCQVFKNIHLELVFLNDWFDQFRLTVHEQRLLWMVIFQFSILTNQSFNIFLLRLVILPSCSKFILLP